MWFSYKVIDDLFNSYVEHYSFNFLRILNDSLEKRQFGMNFIFEQQQFC